MMESVVCASCLWLSLEDQCFKSVAFAGEVSVAAPCELHDNWSQIMDMTGQDRQDIIVWLDIQVSCYSHM